MQIILFSHNYSCFFSSEKYFEDYTSVKDHVVRHNLTDDEHAQSVDCMKISFEKEYPFR